MDRMSEEWYHLDFYHANDPSAKKKSKNPDRLARTNWLQTREYENSFWLSKKQRHFICLIKFTFKINLHLSFLKYFVGISFPYWFDVDN